MFKPYSVLIVNHDGLFSSRRLHVAFLDVFYNQQMLDKPTLDWMWSNQRDIYQLVHGFSTTEHGFVALPYPKSEKRCVFGSPIAPQSPKEWGELRAETDGVHNVALFNAGQWWWVLDHQSTVEQSTIAPLGHCVAIKHILQDAFTNKDFYVKNSGAEIVRILRTDLDELVGWNGSEDDVVDVLVWFFNLPAPLQTKLGFYADMQEVLDVLRKIPVVDAFFVKNVLNDALDVPANNNRPRKM